MTNYTLPDDSHPFDGSMLDSLIEQSVPVKSALTELINKCWYTDELVAVHMQVPANLELYQEYVLENLGESFEVVSIESHVLTTTEELLQTIVNDIYQGDVPVGEPFLDLLHQHVDELAESSVELLIQIKNAHELSIDVLRDLAEIVRNHATMVTPHIVFWADKESEEAFQSSFVASDVTVGLIAIPGFAPREIADYLKLVFRKYEHPFPFDKEDVQKIIRRSRGSGFEIDRLVSQALYPRHPEEEDEHLQGGFPVLQTMVAVALIALIAMVFFLQRYDEAENTNAAAGNGSTQRIVVDIPATQTSEEQNSTNADATGPVAVNGGDTGNAGSDESVGGAEAGTALRIRTVGDVAETSPTETVSVEFSDDVPEEVPAPTVPAEVAIAPQTPAPLPAEPATQPVSQPEPQQEARPVVTQPSPVENPVTSGSAYSAQLQRLLAHPDGNAFIQLYGTYEEANASKFVQDYSIENKFYYFKTDLNGRDWFVVVYGGFVSERAAINERDTLSRKLKEGGPWIRGMANIRTSIKS